MWPGRVGEWWVSRRLGYEASPAGRTVQTTRAWQAKLRSVPDSTAEECAPSLSLSPGLLSVQVSGRSFEFLNWKDTGWSLLLHTSRLWEGGHNRAAPAVATRPEFFGGFFCHDGLEPIVVATAGWFLTHGFSLKKKKKRKSQKTPRWPRSSTEHALWFWSAAVGPFCNHRNPARATCWSAKK